MPEKDIKTPPSDWNLGGDTDTHDDPLLDCLMQLAKLHGRLATRTGLSSGLPLVHNRRKGRIVIPYSP
jgi:ATP-binding cassette subfamily C protein LapB